MAHINSQKVGLPYNLWMLNYFTPYIWARGNYVIEVNDTVLMNQLIKETQHSNWNDSLKLFWIPNTSWEKET